MADGLPYNFGGIPPVSYKNAKILVLPVPHEMTVSFRRGTRFGPENIILASRHMEIWDEETGIDTEECGIHTLPEIDPESDSVHAMMKVIEKTVLSHLKREKFICALGGEHSISFPLIKAHKKYFPDLCVVQLDAHADMRDTLGGSKYSHGTVMRRVRELGCETHGIGVRSLSREESEYLRKDSHAHCHFASTLYATAWDKIIHTIPDIPIYLTIDMDFFDPAIMPETGTPEPGGFFWPETVLFLRKLFAERTIIGIDMVEFAPSTLYSPSSFLSSKLLFTLIALHTFHHQKKV